MKMYENVKLNTLTEDAVVQMLASLFNDIAYMTPEDVRHNIQCLCDGGFPEADRTCPVNTVNYLVSRFSLIFTGFLSSPEFRQAFIDAIAMEQNIDDRSDDNQAEIRADMNAIKIKNAASSGDVVFDFCKYDNEMFSKINSRLFDSFTKLDGYDNAIDEMIDHETEKTKEECGFIVSNFAYLIRAFSRNTIFFAYVSSVLKSVQTSMGLEY